MGIADVSPSLWGECEEQAGMHFCGDPYIHVELIDAETDEPLPFEDGAEGELVYTTLIREAMPVLRFRSRDRVVVNAKPCSCGRGGMRVRCIGRTDDLLIVRGVNLFPTAVREVVAEFRPRVGGPVLIRPAHTGVRQDAAPRVLVELAEDGGADDELARRDRPARSAPGSSSPPRSSSSPTARCRAASTRAGWWTSRSPLRGDAEQRRVAVGALDDVVRRAVGQQPAVAHSEVAGLRVVRDQRERGLLGLDRVAAGEADADVGEAEQAVDLVVLGLLRHGGEPHE